MHADNLVFANRVGARSASASAQLLARSESSLEPQVTRRSASFMLSSAAMSAGRMSPILARGPQLVQRDCTDAQPMSPLAHKELEQAALRKGRGTIGAVSNRLPIPQQPSREAAAVQRSNSLEIGSFLSLSPTMQWLQVRHLSYMYCRKIRRLHMDVHWL